MKKAVYSLVLSEDVVEAVDRMAYAQGTSRSNLINQLLGMIEGDTEFALFTGYVDLDKNRDNDTALLGLDIDFFCQTVAVNGMNQLCFTCDIFDFITLEMSNHMPADVRGKMLRFFAQLLHIIFSEIALPGFIECKDVRFRFLLADRDEEDVFCRSSGTAAGSSCFFFYSDQVFFQHNISLSNS